MAWTTPKNCPFPLGDLHPHLINDSLVQLSPCSNPVFIPNGISIGSAVFVWVQNALSMRKNPKLPLPAFPLGFRHPAGGGPSHGHRQYAQNLVKIARVVREIYLRTDRHTDRQTDTYSDATHHNTLPPLPRAKSVFRNNLNTKQSALFNSIIYILY